MIETVRNYWCQPDRSKEKWKNYDAKLTPLDIIEMQTIDADCNDCLYFKRGKMVKHPGLTTFDGECLKFNKPTKAYPMQFTGHQCFQHRKSQ